MTLPPLATTDDLTARRIAYPDGPQAGTFLGVASAAVRDAAGTAISATTSTLELWGNGGPWLRLPGPPVTAVASVVLDGRTLSEGADYVRADEYLFRPRGWPSPGCGRAAATVTYTHGLPEVPADIVDLVCRMTAAALVAAAAEDDGSGLAVTRISSERLGDYSVTYRADTGMTEMELAERTAERLRARFGGGAYQVGVL